MNHNRIKTAIVHDDQKYIGRYIKKNHPTLLAEFKYLKMVNNIARMSKCYISDILPHSEYIELYDQIYRIILKRV